MCVQEETETLVEGKVVLEMLLSEVLQTKYQLQIMLIIL